MAAGAGVDTQPGRDAVVGFVLVENLVVETTVEHRAFVVPVFQSGTVV